MFILLTSCSKTEKVYPLFNLDQHLDKFQYQRFKEINIDSIQFDLKKEPMDSTEYVAVFQEPFNRPVQEDNPYYFYSIQKEDPKFSSITVFQYLVTSRELILVNHSTEGKYIDKKTIAISGADGNSSEIMRTKYLNDSTLESNYVTRDVSDTGGETETEYTFEKNEVFRIKSDGTFQTISLDTVTRQVIRKADYKISSFYYPNQEYYDEKSNRVMIRLKDYKNYKDFVSKLDNLACSEATPVIRYQNEDSMFNLIPIHLCPSDLIINHYRERNRIRITKDSIYARFKPYEIDSLSHIVKRHLTNRGKEPRFSDSPAQAFFSIEQDKSMTLERLEELLIIISESFNQVNKDEGGGLKLSIQVAEPAFIPVPPPPPIRKE